MVKRNGNNILKHIVERRGDYVCILSVIKIKIKATIPTQRRKCHLLHLSPCGLI